MMTVTDRAVTRILGWRFPYHRDDCAHQVFLPQGACELFPQPREARTNQCWVLAQLLSQITRRKEEVE